MSKVSLFKWVIICSLLAAAVVTLPRLINAAEGIQHASSALGALGY